jgi:hypothetical protein
MKRSGTMMHVEEKKEGLGMYGCCGPMMKHGPRHCGMGFGIILVLAGALWLAARAGWFNAELFWPMAFVAMGSIIVVLNLARGRKPWTGQAQNRERRNQENASPKI